ncbi:MAG: UDP-2,3-diacylglucosamine diphosphatase, partial [Arenimonas sp.]
MTTLFVSDLHLDPVRPAITALFLRFLREEAVHADALYILGDLFEAWVGDDVEGEPAESVRAALRALVDAGVPVHFQRGNRDFLAGLRFAADTGARLLPDPAVVNLYGEPTLLMHGDLLCTGDTAYQAFRAQVRAPQWQAQFLAQPLAAREAFAAKARAASREHQKDVGSGGAMDAITDVEPDAVAQTLARYGVRRLIHGHKHRPAILALDAGGRLARRIV